MIKKDSELKTFAILLHNVKHLVGAPAHFRLLFVTHLTVNLLTFVQIVYLLYVPKIILL